MPKRAGPVERSKIVLDAGLSIPLYKQLYTRLRDEILAGQLQRGARLPSTRTLADELGVSRNTTALAYELLQLEGYLESRVGQGTVVSRHLRDAPAPQRPDRIRAPGAAIQGPSVDRLSARIGPVASVPSLEFVEGRDSGAFRTGEPALDIFPYDVWGRLVARRARTSLSAHAYYQPAAGYEPLRAAIAAHIGISRGVRCAPDQVILTAGAQGALDLAARTLLDPGDATWIENPGYFGAQGALVAAGARLVPIPVDDEGLSVEIGRQRCPEARLVYSTPSHQYPTGVTMSLGRRLELLAWAEQTGTWILEDDYDSEFRFSGRPLEALQGLDQAGRVLYLGTFSKVLFPALRLGYVVAPPDLVEPLLAMRRVMDLNLPILEQLALTDFMQDGHFARHLRRMREHYRRRRDLLCHELRSHLGGLLEVRVPEVGMQVVGWLPPGKDDRRAAALAAAVNVLVLPFSWCSREPLSRGGLVFGFAGTDEAGLRAGVQRLAAALDQF